MLNTIQKAAFELIQSDARFIYTLVDIQKNAPKINSNYILMFQPYMGIFAKGTKQWFQNMKINTPNFTCTENEYYTCLRQSHKLFEMSYQNVCSLLMKKFNESDAYFYKNKSLLEKVLGYSNVGTDSCNGEFCGNTILCAAYSPIELLDNPKISSWVQNISIVAGKLAAFLGCTKYPPYEYNDNLYVKATDYHFYKKCPLKLKTDLGFVLFSILCSINYVIEFIENYFTEEIPQKFKFAYLQYYYLCNFMTELNKENGTNFYLDDRLWNRDFRNCLAHYGLGQYLKSENEIITNDILKGLTVKAFGKDYFTVKAELYCMLKNLAVQIKEAILK
jgi:hypothetical protein